MTKCVDERRMLVVCCFKNTLRTRLRIVLPPTEPLQTLASGRMARHDSDDVHARKLCYHRNGYVIRFPQENNVASQQNIPHDVSVRRSLSAKQRGRCHLWHRYRVKGIWERQFRKAPGTYFQGEFKAQMMENSQPPTKTWATGNNNPAITAPSGL